MTGSQFCVGSSSQSRFEAVVRRHCHARSLAKLLIGDLEGNVRTAKSRARDAELLLDDGGVSENVHSLEVHFDTLDGRDGAGTLR